MSRLVERVLVAEVKAFADAVPSKERAPPEIARVGFETRRIERRAPAFRPGVQHGNESRLTLI